MQAAPWPVWVSWVLFIAILLTLYIAWRLARNVAVVRWNLADAGIGRGMMPARSRKELEEKYTAGVITWEVYDRWRDRLK
jgi:hypothetical protein